jgi:hypothetical protein
MAEKSLTALEWQACESLRQELAAARVEFTAAADELRHSLNPKERALQFVRDRPVGTAVTAIAAGLIAIKLIPLLLWRGRKSILSRFTGQLARAAVGAAVPLLSAKLAGRNGAARAREPATITFTGRDLAPP